MSSTVSELSPSTDYGAPIVPSLVYPAIGPSTTTPLDLPVILKLTLPGRGKSKFGCGEVTGAYKCLNQHHPDVQNPVKYKHNHCDRFTCSECYPFAARRAARRGESRLLGMRDAYARRGIDLGDRKHFEISTSPSAFTEADLLSDKAAYFKKCVVQFLDANMEGYWGGVLFVHPWRWQHDDGTPCEYEDCKKRHSWAWGPHAHFVGYGHMKKSNLTYISTWENVFKKASKLFGEGLDPGLIPGLVRDEDLSSEASSIYSAKLGFVFTYKQIRARGDRDFFATLSYELGHPGIFVEEVVNSNGELDQEMVGSPYAYIGCMSTNKGGSVVLDKGKEPKKCNICQSEMHEFGLDEDKHIDHQADMGVYMVSYKHLIYNLNPKLFPPLSPPKPEWQLHTDLRPPPSYSKNSEPEPGKIPWRPTVSKSFSPGWAGSKAPSDDLTDEEIQEIIDRRRERERSARDEAYL